MTLKLWKYLITNCHGLAIHIVAEEDREMAEKRLEGDPCLLSYRARPLFQTPVSRCPAEPILQRLRRIRLDLETEVNHHLHDSVVTINNTHWPAYRKDSGTLVDLRILDPQDRSPKPRLVFQPNVLRDAGIPEALIEAAAQSNPPGLVFIEDAPQFKGCADQPTSLESTR
jgi:hypothetical protein